MFGVLVVVLRSERVADLRFRTGQRQIPLIVSLRVLKARWLVAGGDVPRFARLWRVLLIGLGPCCTAHSAGRPFPRMGRSRRRTRDLVTQPASQGLSENENGCVRISMMAKSMNALFTGRIQKRKTNPLHHSHLACNTRPVHTVGQLAAPRFLPVWSPLHGILRRVKPVRKRLAR